MKPKTIRIVLADDHELIRDGLRHALAKHSRLKIVGEAENGEKARTLCQTYQPEVLLLDLHMPGSTANETISDVRENCSSTRIIIVTAYDDTAHVKNAISAGVDGYILKDEATQTVVEAILTVARGQVWFSQQISQRLAQLVSEGPGPQKDLTPREIEVLQLMARGNPNEVIAVSLQITERTVKFHVSNIYKKLSISCRSEAVAWAWEQGIVKRES